jgi:hypothetical protein
MLEPNIVKVQSMIRDMSDDQITARLQQTQMNPDPYDYLFATELMQRGKKRAAAAPRQAPRDEQSVRNELLGSSGLAGLGSPPPPPGAGPLPAASPEPAMMASGGVVGLDASPDMYSDRYYANGGIVAFQEGGRTAKAKVEPDEGYGPILYRKADGTTVGMYKTKPKAPPSGGRGLFPPESGAAQIARGLRESRDERRDKIIAGQDLSDFERQQRQDKLSALSDPELSPKEMQGALGYKSPTSGKQPGMSMAEAPEEVTDSTAGIAGLRIDAPASVPRKDLGDFPGLEESVKAPEYDLDTRMADRAAMFAAMGVDPEFYNKEREDIAKEGEAIDERSRKENLLGLAKGFLKVAQTPGTLGQGLAAGAETTLEEIEKSAESIREDRAALKQYQRNLAAAEYAAARGDAQAEMQYKDAAERELRAQLNQDIQNQYQRNVDAYKLEVQRDLTERELAQQLQIATMDANLKLGIAQMSLQENMTNNEAKVMKYLYDAQARGAMTGDALIKLQEELYKGVNDMEIESIVGPEQFKVLSADPAAKEQFVKEYVQERFQKIVKDVSSVLKMRNDYLGSLMGAGQGGYSAQTVGGTRGA